MENFLICLALPNSSFIGFEISRCECESLLTRKCLVNVACQNEFMDIISGNSRCCVRGVGSGLFVNVEGKMSKC